jgi:hypothetical protein
LGLALQTGWNGIREPPALWRRDRLEFAPMTSFSELLLGYVVPKTASLCFPNRPDTQFLMY